MEVSFSFTKMQCGIDAHNMHTIFSMLTFLLSICWVFFSETSPVTRILLGTLLCALFMLFVRLCFFDWKPTPEDSWSLARSVASFFYCCHSRETNLDETELEWEVSTKIQVEEDGAGRAAIDHSPVIPRSPALRSARSHQSSHPAQAPGLTSAPSQQSQSADFPWNLNDSLPPPPPQSDISDDARTTPWASPRMGTLQVPTDASLRPRRAPSLHSAGAPESPAFLNPQLPPVPPAPPAGWSESHYRPLQRPPIPVSSPLRRTGYETPGVPLRDLTFH